MKQIFALLIVGLFLFSVASVSAAPENAGQGRNRDLGKNILEKYQQSVDKYKNVAKELDKERADFEIAKEKIKNFNKLNKAEKANATDKISNFLLKTLDKMDSHLDIMQAWAEKVNITDERRTQILQDISDKRVELDGFRTQIGNATTVDELRSIAKDIKDSWNGFVPSIKKISGELLTERIGNLITTSESLSVKMHAKLDNLSQNDTKVQDMQTLLDQYDSHVSLAKEQYQLAVDTYSHIGNNTNSTSLFSQTKAYLEKAKEDLNEAYKDLKSLVNDYRDYTHQAIVNNENETNHGNESDNNESKD